jgi:hypothetical protein
MFLSHSSFINIRPTNQQHRISFISFMYGLFEGELSNELENVWKEAVGTKIRDLPEGRE